MALYFDAIDLIEEIMRNAAPGQLDNALTEANKIEDKIVFFGNYGGTLVQQLIFPDEDIPPPIKRGKQDLESEPKTRKTLWHQHFDKAWNQYCLDKDCMPNVNTMINLLRKSGVLTDMGDDEYLLPSGQKITKKTISNRLGNRKKALKSK